MLSCLVKVEVGGKVEVAVVEEEEDINNEAKPFAVAVTEDADADVVGVEVVVEEKEELWWFVHQCLQIHGQIWKKATGCRQLL